MSFGEENSTHRGYSGIQLTNDTIDTTTAINNNHHQLFRSLQTSINGNNHQDAIFPFSSSSSSTLLKDWCVTLSGYSSTIDGSLDEYTALRQLIIANGGKLERSLLLSCTHLIAKRGSSSKCVAAWEHNKKVKRNNNNSGGGKEILVVTPEIIPAYLQFVRERQLLQQGQQNSLTSPVQTNTNNSNDEPEAKNPEAENDDATTNQPEQNNNIQNKNHQQEEFDPTPFLVKPLTGYTCCYTGFAAGAPRTELEEKIKLLGGEVSRTMMKGVDFLIVPSGIEVPYDFGGALSQSSSQVAAHHHHNPMVTIHLGSTTVDLNMEKLRLAEGMECPIVYSGTFLGVLSTKERPIDVIVENLAKAKRAKPISMSQSLAQTTEKILGNSASPYSLYSPIVADATNNTINQSMTNHGLFSLSQQQQQQPRQNNNNNAGSASSSQQQQQQNQNQNHSSGSVSPFCLSQQQQQSSNPSSQQQQQDAAAALATLTTPPVPPPPPPMTIHPSLLRKFASWTQDTVVCALFTTDDQLRNLTWLMNTIGVSVITIPNPIIINETIFLVGSELDSAYHDTVKKYFDSHYGISEFIRKTAYSLHLWLNTVAELMMILVMRTDALIELNANLQVAREKLAVQQQNEELSRSGLKLEEGQQHQKQQPNNHDEDAAVADVESTTINADDWAAVVREFESKREELRHDIDLVEARVNAMFDGETPARSLDNHAELFPNHIMSYYGWVGEMKKQEQEENAQYNYRSQNYYHQNGGHNSMMNHHHYSDDVEGDPNSSSQNFDISKMVSRILSRSQHYNNNTQQQTQQQQSQLSQQNQNFSAYYKTIQQQNNTANDENSNNSHQNSNQSQRSGKVKNNNNNNSTSDNKMIQVSRNPARTSIFSTIFFVIDGAMTDECVQITKHAIHLGGGVYDRSSSNNQQQSSSSSLSGTRPNKFFVISHARQRLWGDPSLTEEQRRSQGFSNDVTVDWLLHCVKLGTFIDPKSSFVFNSPVNKLQQHYLPPAVAGGHNNHNSKSKKHLQNHNSNTKKILASPFVLEPRKFLKKQISHAGVVAMIPKCGEEASVCELMRSVVTLLGGHTVKVPEEKTNNNNSGLFIAPAYATKKLTHIIFPTGNWMSLTKRHHQNLNSPRRRAIGLSSSASSSPIKNQHQQSTCSPRRNHHNLHHSLESGSIRQRDDENNSNTNNDNDDALLDFYDSIVQKNVEWLATVISLLPSVGDYKSKFINDPNSNNPTKPNPNLLYIVSQDWLEKSAKVGYFVDESEFIVEMNPFVPTVLPSKLHSSSGTVNNNIITTTNNNNNKTIQNQQHSPQRRNDASVVQHDDDENLLTKTSPLKRTKQHHIKKVLPSSEVPSLTQIVGSTQSQLTSSQVRNKLDKTGLTNASFLSSPSMIKGASVDDDSQQGRHLHQSMQQQHQAPPPPLPALQQQNQNQNYQEHSFDDSQLPDLPRIEMESDVNKNGSQPVQNQHHHRDQEQEQQPVILQEDEAPPPSQHSKQIANDNLNSSAKKKSSFFDSEDDDEEEAEEENQDGETRNTFKERNSLAYQKLQEVQRCIMSGDGDEDEESNQQQQEKSNEENKEDAAPVAKTLACEEPNKNNNQSQSCQIVSSNSCPVSEATQQQQQDAAAQNTNDNNTNQEQQHEQTDDPMMMVFVDANEEIDCGGINEEQQQQQRLSNVDDDDDGAARMRGSRLTVNRFTTSSVGSKVRNSGRPSSLALFPQQHQNGDEDETIRTSGRGSDTVNSAEKNQQAQQHEDFQQQQQRPPRDSFFYWQTWYVWGEGSLINGRKLRIATEGNAGENTENTDNGNNTSSFKIL